MDDMILHTNISGSFFQRILILNNAGPKVYDLGVSSLDSLDIADTPSHNFQIPITVYLDCKMKAALLRHLAPNPFPSITPRPAGHPSQTASMLKKQCKLHVYMVCLCTSGPFAFFLGQAL